MNKLNFNFKKNKYKYYPKTNEELQEIIINLTNQYRKEVDLNVIDVSNIKDFSYIFKNKPTFTGDVSEWNIFNGINFEEMFANCYNFNSVLNNWDVSNGINFTKMFYGCKKFNADLSNWNVENAKEWNNFAKNSLLKKYPEKIPERFRSDYL